MAITISKSRNTTVMSLHEDIVRNIMDQYRQMFEHVQETQRQYLLWATLASRFFKSPGLDALWYTLPSFLPLLKLLPTFRFDRPTGNYLLSRHSLDSADWKRFDDYARRVRSIQIPARADISDKVYKRFNLLRPNYHLPGVQKIEFSPGSIYHPPTFLVSLCLSSSLKSLQVTPHESNLIAKFNKAPILFHELFLSQLAATPSIYLTEFQIDGMLPDSFVDPIRNLTSLRKLTVWIYNMQMLEALLRCSNLIDLDLRLDGFCPEIPEDAHIPYAPHLRHLRLSGSCFALSTILSGDRGLALPCLISLEMNNITDTRLRVKKFRLTPPKNLLRPCRCHCPLPVAYPIDIPSLRRLYIYGRLPLCSLDFSPTTWSNLEVLKLCKIVPPCSGPDEMKNESHPLEIFLFIAQHCIKLLSLSIDLEINKSAIDFASNFLQNTVTKYDTHSNCLRRLSVGLYFTPGETWDIDDVTAIMAFLGCIFPNIPGIVQIRQTTVPCPCWTAV